MNQTDLLEQARSLKEETEKRLQLIKQSRNAVELIPIKRGHEPVGELVPVVSGDQSNTELILLMTKWRNENSFAYPTQFKATLEGTQRWVQQQLIERTDRILFMIRSEEIWVGHIGCAEFDFENRTLEIDNVVRGEKNISKGIMTLATQALLRWIYITMNGFSVYLRVFADNDRAVSFYEKLGFVFIKDVGMKKVKEGDTIKWVEAVQAAPERYFRTMKHQV